LIALPLAATLRPAYLWTRAWLLDRPAVVDIPPHHADDASRLNATPVAEVWPVPAEVGAAEDELRELLARARREKLPISIAGARHSMGGHTISRDGIVLDMLPLDHLELDAPRRLLRAGAGARWSQIVPWLDERGYSVAIMQSNNDFSVGGSLSVNCHGWQHNRPPIASTVESLRLMRADGNVRHCSREENRELFSLVLGGYGLFGVILEAQLRVVPNMRYRPESEIVPADQYARRFREKVDGASDIGMVYGRLCVVPGEETFLKEAILTVFREAPCQPSEMPPLELPSFMSLRREVFRAQIGSQAGKELRWKAERTLGEQVAARYVSRNQLLNEPAEVYQEQNADRTDILHEYFVPPEELAPFLARAQSIIPRHSVELMNVTVRNVLADTDAFLRYADRDMFALVMLYNQPRTVEADLQMQTLTRELIEAALACGGRYYLPYRLHATPEQFRAAYPQAEQFFELKRRYDPDELLQNRFYAAYGKR
jgi:FAD/FMN-containing dehydrogenase